MAATIWVKPLGATWQPVTTSRDAGVWHEQLAAVSDQWGPKTATFTLRRQPRGVFPDLLARTPVAIDVGGVRVWAGRIKETPENSGPARQISVTCTGGQAILDDGRRERILAHTRLSDWKDQRTFLAANLTGARQVWKVTAQPGGITVGVTNGDVIVDSTYGGVTIDLGPGNACKRIVATLESSNSSAALELRCAGGNSAAIASAAEQMFSPTLTAIGPGPAIQANTFTTARRYVHLYLIANTGFTASAEHWARISSVQVFADAAYESGNVSVLDAQTIILDALQAATGLHPDWSGVGAPTFAFPNFAPDGPRTPRELVAAANAPISQWFFKIDESLRPVYRPRATVPVVDLGAWLGAEGDSYSSNSDEGVVTSVLVRGTGADGSPIRSTRSQTGTIVDRQGGVAAQGMDASYTLTQAFADKLGDAYLDAHRVSPFKGQNVVGVVGARRSVGGAPVDPAHLLLLTGELARRMDLTDPDTGSLGRTAVIDQVTYRDDQRTADIDLDNTRRDFEALTERLGLLVPSN